MSKLRGKSKGGNYFDQICYSTFPHPYLSNTLDLSIFEKVKPTKHGRFVLLINQFSWETTIIIQVPNLLKQGVSDLIQISDSFKENTPLISNTQCVELDEMQFNLRLTSA